MIVFEKLRYQNIMSTGNQFTEILLTKSKSTLIIGENGAGKSTFIEALTFALYGRPYRNINKPQLVNSITGKNLLVELEFRIGKKKYLIRRGIKPAIFEIHVNGKLINQAADAREYQEMLERNILKLNFKSFSQIVVLGSANYVPFMQLPSHVRRGVVEDLLDIQIFSIMNSLLKDKVNQVKQDMQELDYQIHQTQNRIDLHAKYLASLKQNNDDIIQIKLDKIAEHETAIDAFQNTIADLRTQVDTLTLDLPDYESTAAKRNEIDLMRQKLSERVRKLEKEIEFFHDHDTCPTCRQGIDHDFKSDTIETRNKRVGEINEALAKLGSQYAKWHSRLLEIAEVNKQLENFNSQISQHNQSIKHRNSYISQLNDEIEQINKQSTKVVSESDDTASYEAELSLQEKKKEALTKQRALHEIAAYLLKDSGIKTNIIRQYVPVMNTLINKYLASMDFFVSFELDENFAETIKSRFRDDFTYASFSEGEKLRIDLALMFTWRAIAKLRNSASTNILIMDEVFDSSLDSTGTEEFLKLLETLSGESNVFIISHKGDVLQDKFHSIIKFEKHANFSRIALVA